MNRFNLKLAITIVTLLGMSNYVLAAHTVATNPATPVCPNESVEITLTSDDAGTYTYEWSWINELNELQSGTGKSLSVSPKKTTTYTYKVYSAGTLVEDGTVDVDVTVAPTVTVAKSVVGVKDGGTVTLSASASGADSYQWYDENGNAIAGATSNTYDAPDKSTTYQVAALKGECEGAKATVQVLRYSVSANKTTVCYNEAVEITVTGGHTYVLNGVSNSTGVFKVNPTAYPIHTYTVTIKDASDVTIATEDVEINVNPQPIVTAVTPSSPQTCSGVEVKLTAEKDSPNDGTFEWFDAGGSIGKGESIYVKPAITTKYWVQFTDAVTGCISERKDVTITVVTPTVPAIIADKATVCLGDVVNLSVSAGTPQSWYLKSDSREIGTSTTCAYTTEIQGDIVVCCNVEVDGCIVRAEKTIIVAPKLTPTISGNLSICEGQTTTLTASTPDDGNTTYKWTPGGAATRSITVSAAGTYQVEVKRNGCTAIASEMVVVNAQPTINFIGNTTVCNGLQASVEAQVSDGSGSYSYLWNDLNNTTQSTLVVTPATTTTYTVTVTDNVTGCVQSKPVQIKVVNPVVPTIEGPDQVCSETPATWRVPEGYTSYLWSDGVTTTPEFTTTLTTNTQLSVTVKTTDGCTLTSLVKNVTVNPMPSGEISGSNKFCPGESTTLSAPAGYTYLWNTNAKTQEIEVSTAGTYWVDLTLGTCTVRKTIEVSENTPIKPTISASKTSICDGEEVTLTASNYGEIVRWSDGVNNLGTDPILTDRPTKTTTYELVVKDVNGCEINAFQQIIVNKIPILTISADKTEVCSGGEISVSVTGTPSGSTYVWSKAGTLSNGNATLTFKPADGDTKVSVTVKTPSDCEATIEQPFTVIPKPTGEITGVDKVCKGETVTLNAPAGGQSYLWSNGATTATMTSAPLNAKITFTVDIVYPNGCTQQLTKDVDVIDLPTGSLTASPEVVCLGEPVTLTAPAGDSYTWDGVAGDKIKEVTPDVIGNIIYSVTVTSAGCSNTFTKTINVVEKPSASIDNVNSTTSICKAGDAATIVAKGGVKYRLNGVENTTGIFTVNPTTTTTYTILVYNANDCESSIPHTITVKGIEEPIVSGNLNVCQGGNTTLTSSTQADTYEWKRGTTVIGNGVSQDIVNVQSTETYYLTITKDGCSATKQFEIKMVTPPTDAAIVGDAVCEGESITLEARGTGSYKWGDGSTGNTLTVTPTAANHTYTLTVTNDAGCEQTITKSIIINSKPAVSISGDNKVCADDEITLTASSSASGATYSWDDDANTSGPTLTVTPTMSRNYTVTITANGCTNTATHTIEVVTISKPTITTTKTDICKNEKVTLTASGDANCEFIWDELGRTASSVEVQPTATTTYHVVAHNTLTGCKSVKGEITITVHDDPTPTVSVSPAATICKGESVTLTVTGGTQFTCNGETNTTGIFTLSPDVTTTPYIIEVSNGAGCKSTITQKITVNEKPTVTISGATIACQGTKVILTAQGADSYEWSTGAKTESIEVDVVNASPISVWVKGKNASGCWSDQVPHTINVNPKPTITISGESSICVGGSTTLTASGAATYIWTWDGGTRTGNSITVSPTSETIYTVEGTDANGCKNTQTFTVKVHEIPTATISGPTELCENGKIELIVNATGADSYSWNTGENSQKIEVTEAGTYTVTVTGAGNCTATASHTVTLKTIDGKITGATTSCSGADVNLLVTGGDTYLWDSNPDITSSESTSANITVNPKTTTTYLVTITKDGCTKRVSHTVTIPTTENIVIITGETNVCVGKPFTLTATLAGATNFYWKDGPAGATYTPTLNAAGSQDYIVFATDKNSCPVSDTITVTAHALPKALINGQANGSTSTCKNGAPITLTASGGKTYKWAGDGITEPTNSIQTVQPTATTTYTLVAYNEYGCESAVATHQIIVNELPTVSIDGPTQTCKGSKITLTAKGGTSYKWSNGETTQSITPTITGDVTYSVTVTDDNGCSNEARHEVTIYPAEQVVITADKLKLCAGESVELVASDIIGGSYVWNTTETSKSITVSTAGTYKVTVTYGNGCTTTAEVTVTVNPLPVIEIKSSTGEFSICPNDEIELTATPGQSYLWTPGNLTSQSIKVKPTTETQYTVVVTDANGCVGTAKKTITIKTLPNAEITGPTTSCADEEVTLTASGGTVVWKDDLSSVNPRIVTPTVTTTYTGTITGPNGCSVEKSWTVNVVEKPTISVVGNTTVCYGESVSLTASGADTYTWTWEGGSQIGATLNHTPLKPTTYTVVGTDANGCKAKKEIPVLVNPIPTVTISGDKEVCEGGQVTLTASGCDSYEWSTGETGPTITVTPTTPSETYWVIGTKNGCKSEKTEHKVTVKAKPVVTVIATPVGKVCKGTTVTLTAQGATEYNWSNGATSQSIDVVADADVTYSVTGITNGCTSEVATHKVEVLPLPSVIITGDLDICKGESTTLTASGADTYVWDNGLGAGNSITVSPGVNTTYKVTGTDANGCVATYSVEVKVYEKPSITISGVTEICEGSSTTLTAVAANAVAYKWSTGATNADLDVSQAGTYWVEVTGEGGCVSRYENIVVSYKTPVNGSISGGETPVCQGSTVTLTASGGKTYKWDNNMAEGADLVISNIQKTETYWVTITGANGCTQRLSRTVTVNPTPSIDIQGVLNFCEGGSTKLTAVGDGTFLWSTGETTRSITVTVADDYTVTITDVNGCKNSKTVTVTRNALPTATITNESVLDDICEGDNKSITLIATGADSYLWNTGATTDRITVTPTETTTYSVIPTKGGCTGSPITHEIRVHKKPVITLTGETEICAGETVTLIADGADEYSWDGGVSYTTDATYTKKLTTAGTYNFVVIGKNTSTECTAELQHTVIVKANPVVTVSGDLDICAGESTTLTASPQGANVTYLWSNGSTERTASFNNLLSNTDYSVKVTVDGCKTTKTGTIEVHPMPIVTISTNTGKTEICREETIKLTASGGNTYFWEHDGNRNASIDVSPTATTTYTVVVTGAGGCEVKESITITVNELPTVTITADKPVVCEGDAVTLTANGGNNWQWYKGNVAIAGAEGKNQYYTIPSTTAGTTTYKVVVENANKCKAEATYQLVVQKLPEAKITGDLNICKGESTQLSAPLSDSYLWSTGETTQTITVSPLADKSYEVTIKVGNCESTASETVKVVDLPEPTISASDSEPCAGQTVTLDAGAGYTYYKWSTGKEGSNMQKIAVSPLEETTYTVEVTNASGCKGVAQTTIAVAHVPAPTISIISGSNKVCAGEEVVLKASTANSYQWSENVPIGYANSQTVVVNPTQTSTYTLTTTNKAGCASTATITIEITKLPTPKIIGESNICKGGMVTLKATSDIEGTTFRWNTGETTPTINVKPTQTTTYQVWASVDDCENPVPDEFEVTVNNAPVVSIIGTPSICSGESVTLTATGGVSFLWKNIEGAERTKDKITVKPTQTTTYECEITDANGCTATAEYEVTVNPLPKAEIQAAKVKICRGTSTTLTAVGGTTFLWSGDGIAAATQTNAVQEVSPAYTTDYTVEVTNANGCTSSATITIEVVQEPKAHIEGATEVCAGSSTTLRVVSDDKRTYTYRWHHNNSTEATAEVTPLVKTEFKVSVFDGECEKILPHTVDVTTIEDPKISGSVYACVGEPITLTIDNSGEFVSYQWDGGQTTPEITLTPAEVGNHTFGVTVTDAKGCTASNTIEVVVNPLPEAKVSASVPLLCAGENTITLTGEGAGVGGSYSWYSDELATVLLPGGAGVTTYTINDLTVSTKVYLVATDMYGCASKPAEYEIVVVQKPTPTITSSVPSNKICEGNSLQLTASDPDPEVTFEWGDGTPGAVLQVTAAGEYRVIATNKAGCTSDATISVELEPLPEASIESSIQVGEVGTGDGTKVCSGTRVVLTAKPESTPTMPYKYKWNTGSDEPTITPNPTATTTYSVTVTSATGCSSVATIQIEVNKFVTIEQPDPLCAGDPITLTAQGDDLSNYKWYCQGRHLDWLDNQSSITYQYEDMTLDASKYQELTFKVEALYNNKCLSDTSVTVVLYGQPTDLSINGIKGENAIDSVCVNAPKQLSIMGSGLSATTTYKWTGLNVDGQTGQTVTVTPAVAGEEAYSCLVTTNGGCDTTVSITLKAISIPEISVSADTTICANGTANLRVESATNCPAGTTFVWTSAGGGGGEGTSINVQPTATTTYTVTVKTPAPLECSTTADVTVTVIPQQKPVITPDNAFVCLDESGVSEVDVKLTAPENDSEGRPFATYNWYAENDPTNSLGTTFEITIPKENITATRIYVLDVTTQEGCEGTNRIEIPVSQKPSVSIKGESQVCAGKSLLLQADAPVNVARYEWKDNNGTLLGEGESVTVWPTKTSHTFYLTVYNDKDCRFEVNPGHQVTVLDVPIPEITADNNPVCAGDKVVLTAQDLASGTCTFTWDNGETGPTRTIESLMNTTTVSVKAINQNGCDSTVTYTIIVNPLPKLTITGNTQVCVGDSVLLSVADANGTYNEYSWSGGTWKSANANNSQVWVYPTNVNNPTSYTVTSTDANTCAGAAVTHSILAYAKPIAKINDRQMATDTICMGESLTLKATGGTKFMWSTGAETSEITTPVYKTPTSELGGVDAYVFWVDVYNEANCAQRDSVWIKVASKPSAYINVKTVNTSICEGETVEMEGVATAVANTVHGDHFTYLWTNNTGETIDNPTQPIIKVQPTKTTTYTLTITDNKTLCQSQVLQVINVNSKPAVTLVDGNTGLQVTNGAVCGGSEVVLRVDGDLTNLTFEWYKDNNPTGETSHIYRDIPIGPTTYYVIVTNNTGCSTMPSDLAYSLTYNPIPTPTITIDGGADDKLCLGESITLNAEEDLTHDATKYSYVWTANGSWLSDKQSITENPQVNTTYVYTVTDENTGCTRSDSKLIYVSARPEVTLESSLADNAVYCAGEPITLRVTPKSGTNASDLNYHWFEDGVAIGTNSATLTVTPEGDADNVSAKMYTYSVVVSNKDSGCEAEGQLEWKVTVAPLPLPEIKIYDDNNGSIEILPTEILCPNREVRLKAQDLAGIFEYQWLSQTGGDITNPDDPTQVTVQPATTTTYTLTIRNKNTKCERSVTTTINVLSMPNIKITSSAQQIDGKSVVCVGAPAITLNVVAADGSKLDETKYQVEWFAVDGTSLGRDVWKQIIQTDNAVETTYKAVVSNKVGMQCPIETEHTIKVMEAPTRITIDAKVDGTLLEVGKYVCAGEPVLLAATEQQYLDYEWRDNWGTVYSNENKREFTVYPEKTTIYTCKITNIAGCSYEVSREILVNPLPVVTISGANTLCLDGSKLTLTATANTPESKTTIHWTWKANGGQGEFDGYVWEFAPTQIGEYTITAVATHESNGIKCESKPATHIVNVAGVPNVSNLDLTVTSSANGQACINTPIVIEATEGYSKYIFGTIHVIGTDEVYTIKQEGDDRIWNITETGEGEKRYYCDFYNEAGCWKRQEITVTVNPKPDAVTITAAGSDGETYGYVENEEITICEGGTVTLEAEATGNNNTYSWTDTDGKVWGTSKSIPVSPKLTTDYYLSVTNASGCEVTGKFTVKVIPMDKLTVTANRTADSISICQGSTDKITLRVEGSASALYDWRSSLGDEQKNKPSSILIDAPQQDVEWFVEVSSSANTSETTCKSIASVKIDVIPLPDNTTGTISVKDNGLKTVCAGSEVVLTASQKYAETYRWSTGEVKPEISVLMPNVLEETTVKYWAIGRNSLGCENTQDTMWIELIVKPLPDPQIISRLVCYEGETLTLEADDKTLNYIWYDENGLEVSKKYTCEVKHDVAGTYTYRLVATNNISTTLKCESTITFVVTVIPFTVQINGLAYICSGASTQLWVENCPPADGYQFTWTYAGNIVGQQDTLQSVSQLGTYFVEVVTPWGTKDDASFEVRQSETPSVKFGTPTPVCQGDRFVNIPYTVIGGNPTSYSVIFNQVALDAGFVDVMDAAMTSGYILINAPTAAPAGTYQASILLTNPNGCQSVGYNVSFTIGIDLIQEVWDDVIICDNQNQEFDGYQWYRNGERITGATLQYYSELGGFSGEYYVVAYNKTTGLATASCVKSYDNKQNIAISPNPLSRNQTLRVAIPFSTDVLFGAQIEIVDAIGRVIYRMDKVENINDIFVTYPDGVYMVRVRFQTGEVLTEKFVVQ